MTTGYLSIEMHRDILAVSEGRIDFLNKENNQLKEQIRQAQQLISKLTQERESL